MSNTINCIYMYICYIGVVKFYCCARGAAILYIFEMVREMNKNDLVDSIASAADISKVAAEKGLNGLLSSMAEAMEEGERVTLVGFGSFSIVERAPRVGRNPKTGEKIAIPPRKVVKFRPGRKLSEKVQ